MVVVICASKKLQRGNTGSNRCVHALRTTNSKVYASVWKCQQVSFAPNMCSVTFLCIYNLFYSIFSFDFSWRITPIQYNVTRKSTLTTVGEVWKWSTRCLSYQWWLRSYKTKKLAKCYTVIMQINIGLVKILQSVPIYLNNLTLEQDWKILLGFPGMEIIGQQSNIEIQGWKLF